MTDLTDHMDVDGPDDLTDEAWAIGGDKEAAWALRKIAKAKDEMERLQASYEAERAALDDWITAATKPHEDTVSFFTGKLIGYRLRLEDDDPDLPRTYKLPGGNITRRAGRERVEVVDEDAALAWAEQHAPDAVRRTLRKSDLPGEPKEGRLVTDDGEVVPGVQVVRPDDSYGVTVG